MNSPELNAEYEAMNARLIKFAEEWLLRANTAIAMIKHNPNIQPPYEHPLDPESWNIVKINANRILNACRNKEFIENEWIEMICAECGI